MHLLRSLPLLMLLPTLLGAAPASSASPAASTAPAPAVRVSPQTRTAPINPFIYGQFIEHLGRCIYGGIWAEMLEDRKFHYPITKEYAPYRDYKDSAYPVVAASPWELVGAESAVQMSREDVFVGRHTPVLRQGSTLRQRDLGIVAGKAYTGYLWAKAVNGEGVELTLRLAGAPDAVDAAATAVRVQAGDYVRHRFEFVAPVTSDKAVLELKVQGADLRLGTLSLMPADNVRGMRRDTLALLRQLNSPIYRWPGGNFTSGYDWRDGVGDRDRRPPRSNPAWTGVEHNDFGTDEFLDFCRELGTQPMIAANTGLGDAQSAAAWVEYCNGSTATQAGAWRARNGHAAPFAVKYWCVGNEMFGPWQLGFMQLQHYTIKHNLVAEAMRAADPSLVLSGVGAIGHINTKHDPDQVAKGVDWSEGMLSACADHMDLISEHFYEGRVPWTEAGPRISLAEHVVLLRKTIRKIATNHRALQARLPALKGRVVPIAMDEWNYWHREYEFGELGCRYDLADTLGVAIGLHEFFRQADIIHMAHYAQTVNVIGAIKTSRTEAEMEGTGLVLQLYRAEFGSKPLRLDGDFGPLDVCAALSEDESRLTIAVVNPDTREHLVPLALEHLQAAGPATRFLITGASPSSMNAPGEKRQIDLTRHTNVSMADALQCPPLSCVLYVLPVRKP